MKLFIMISININKAKILKSKSGPLEVRKLELKYSYWKTPYLVIRIYFTFYFLLCDLIGKYLQRVIIFLVIL